MIPIGCTNDDDDENDNESDPKAYNFQHELALEDSHDNIDDHRSNNNDKETPYSAYSAANFSGFEDHHNSNH